MMNIIKHILNEGYEKLKLIQTEVGNIKNQGDSEGWKRNFRDLWKYF